MCTKETETEHETCGCSTSTSSDAQPKQHCQSCTCKSNKPDGDFVDIDLNLFGSVLAELDGTSCLSVPLTEPIPDGYSLYSMRMDVRTKKIYVRLVPTS